MNIFNIALVPRVISLKVIEYARYFSSISDGYLLGEASLPHVTLYQFKGNEDELARIVSELEAVDIRRSLVLRFEEFSCITFDHEVYWASLMPDKVHELTEMHGLIANLINHPVKKNYDPHMTLMSTRDRDYELVVDSLRLDYTPLCDEFILSIGRSDEIGQYLELIHLF